MIPDFLGKELIPHKSGVYIFKDSKGRVLYVGKAIDLFHRVASYFSRDLPLKTQAMVEKIASMDSIIVESELEALILEANLIKKYLPPFNVRLTDDKDYLYIGLTREDFPKVITIRRMDLGKMKKYWGPFPSSKTVRDTLKLLRKVFPWCSASQGQALRACFYYHLGLCPGSCVGLISKENYNKTINRFSKFMEGKKEELISELVDEMERYAKEQRFEEALKIKKMVDGISYLTQPNRTKMYLENPNFLEEENRLALEQLQKDLQLTKLPERIEGYDISNISGKDATGSLVVLTNGDIDKSQYRKFKIRISGKPNDVAMMREMIQRRLNHPEWPLPDLILVDGGRAQVNGVLKEILLREKRTGVKPIHLEGGIVATPFLFGLAKKMEWLYPPEGEVIKLSKRSLSLKLLQKLRDESHRFAVSYHRKLRDKNLLRASV